MKKILNRNHLKFIGCLTMLIDHIGVVLFPKIIAFRVVGRIAFPLFAFFIAEGMYYSKNRKRYKLTMLVFALISQIPYSLLFGLKPNIMFTFLIAMQLIEFYDKIKKSDGYTFNNYIYFANLLILVAIVSLFGIVDYGFWGVLLVFLLYAFKDNIVYRMLSMAACLVILSIRSLPSVFALVQPVSLLAIALILIYNGEKGKPKFKYAFYLFYPVHIAILYVLSLLGIAF